MYVRGDTYVYKRSYTKQEAKGAGMAEMAGPEGEMSGGQEMCE